MTAANDQRAAAAATAEGDVCSGCAALRTIAADLQFWARRYADGRMTYVAGLVNEHTRALLAMGIELKGDPAEGGAIFARDGMGRAFDGLTDAEASEPALLGEDNS